MVEMKSIVQKLGRGLDSNAHLLIAPQRQGFEVLDSQVTHIHW